MLNQQYLLNNLPANLKISLKAQQKLPYFYNGK